MAGQGPGPQARGGRARGHSGRTRGGMLAEGWAKAAKASMKSPGRGAGFLRYQSMAASMSWRACARGIGAWSPREAAPSARGGPGADALAAGRRSSWRRWPSWARAGTLQQGAAQQAAVLVAADQFAHIRCWCRSHARSPAHRHDSWGCRAEMFIVLMGGQPRGIGKIWPARISACDDASPSPRTFDAPHLAHRHRPAHRLRRQARRSAPTPFPWTLGRHLRQPVSACVRGLNEMFVWSHDPLGTTLLPQIDQTGANSLRLVWDHQVGTKGRSAQAHRRDDRAQDGGHPRMPQRHRQVGRALQGCINFWNDLQLIAGIQAQRRWTILNIANEAGTARSATRIYLATYGAAVESLRRWGYSADHDRRRRLGGEHRAAAARPRALEARSAAQPDLLGAPTGSPDKALPSRLAAGAPPRPWRGRGGGRGPVRHAVGQ